MEASLKNLRSAIMVMFQPLVDSGDITLTEEPVSTSAKETKPRVCVVFVKFRTDVQQASKSQRTAIFSVEAVFEAGRTKLYSDGLDLIDKLDLAVKKHWTAFDEVYRSLPIIDLILSDADLAPRANGVPGTVAKIELAVTYVKVQNNRRLT